MQNTAIVLLPPLIVLLAAFISKKLNSALLLGVIAGALIAADFSLVQTAKIIGQRFFGIITDIDNLQMYSFLFMLSTLVVLLSRTGGAHAFAQLLTTKLKSARMAQTSSVLLSLTLFIDDYLSGLTVGHVMRPITDRFHIPRAKLAYLVHSLTGPLVILVPVSSWVATITATLDQAGVGTSTLPAAKIIADPFFIYLESIPYIFYSLLTLLSVVFIIKKGISFGPMYTHEHIAQTEGNLFGRKPPIIDRIKSTDNESGSLADLLVPLITLISCVFIGSLWAGGYHLFGGNYSALEALKHNNKIFLVLFCAGLISLVFSFMFALLRKRIKITHIPEIVVDGIHLMRNAVLMVILASVLGKIMREDLMTGTYLAHVLYGTLNITLLPLIFFIIATITAMLTGSSWGTMILLIPIAIQMLTTLTQVTLPTNPESLVLLFPVLGAIFSGSVCGDHLSPISETTIMTATSSGAYPLDHAQTQFPYAIPAIISCIVGYLLSGYFAAYSNFYKLIVPLGISVVLCCTLLWFMNFLRIKKNQQ